MDLFLIEDDDLLKKYNTISGKVSTDIKKQVDNKPVYNKKILKTKIRFYTEKATDSYDKEMPKVNSNHACLAVITIDSALKKRKKLLFLSAFKRIQIH